MNIKHEKNTIIVTKDDTKKKQGTEQRRR